ncbi:MAG: PAS domain-containing protein [Deltaproteobacteria bacterium]|nr:PAS domain-containing protein [Deltaproteobacteria bacterium]
METGAEEKTIVEQDAWMLESILHHAADGICVCHNTPEAPHVRFTHWNPQMVLITGYTLEEINRLGWYQTLYPDPEVRERAIERMARMRTGDDIQAEEWTITRKDGEKGVFPSPPRLSRKKMERCMCSR